VRNPSVSASLFSSRFLVKLCWSWNDAVGLDIRTCRAKQGSYLGSGRVLRQGSYFHDKAKLQSLF
jgi:hypothetical protein